MNSLQSAYSHHAFAWWLGLLVLTILLGAWLLGTRLALRRLETRFDDVFSELGGDSTARMLTEYLGTVRSTAATVARVKREHDEMAALMPAVVRHVGLVRFTPFHDTGGDQSFTLAILDGRCDGIVITGLHSRNDSRLYAKPIQGGQSQYTLTPEEREAMNRALNGQVSEVPV